MGDFHLLISSARTMHQNFYENEATEGAIHQSIEYAQGFRLLLEYDGPSARRHIIL